MSQRCPAVVQIAVLDQVLSFIQRGRLLLCFVEFGGTTYAFGLMKEPFESLSLGLGMPEE